MGWGYGVNADGREIGYTVDATCDVDGCEKSIDRGLAYVCGGMHDGGDLGCGGYFCYAHLTYTTLFAFEAGESETLSPQFCPSCVDRVALDQMARMAVSEGACLL